MRVRRGLFRTDHQREPTFQRTDRRELIGAAMAKQDSLKQYRAKRDFRRSGEPGGRKAKPRRRRPRFVIQKHDARSLHYDFRLEAEGVLKSWAVPKGPSTNPKDKRLAMPTTRSSTPTS